MRIAYAFDSAFFGTFRHRLRTDCFVCNNKYRDLGVLVSFGVTLWMYITPVVYPVSQVSDSFRPLALLNPVAPLIETFRYGFLGSGTFPWQYLILSFAVTAVVLLFGIIVFNRVEKNFIDTV